jgi:hypothetical protein
MTRVSRTRLAAKCHHRPEIAPSVVKAPPIADDPREPAMPDPTADHEPELLTITEAADVLRAPVATLRYWRHLGTGPNSFRLGRRVLYRRADLRTWIDAQADQSPRR